MGERKSLLKKAMSGSIPNGLDAIRKKGFSSPMEKWLSKGFSSSGYDYVLRGFLCGNNYLNEDWICKNYDVLDSGKKFLLISVELWCRRWLCGDKESSSNFSENAILAL